MHQLHWLEGRRFRSLERSGYRWILDFEGGARLAVASLWRLLEASHVRVTSEDDGHQFGLPAPVDAAAIVNRSIGGQNVTLVNLQEATLDLELHFPSGHVFQIIPDSAGYESWEAHGSGSLFVACGGGSLASFEDPPGGTRG